MALFLMPTYVFYADGRAVLVAAQTPHAALEPGWADHPNGPFPTNGAGPPETVVVVSFPPTAPEEAPSLAALSEEEKPVANVQQVSETAEASESEAPAPARAAPKAKGWPKGKPRGPRVKE